MTTAALLAKLDLLIDQLMEDPTQEYELGGSGAGGRRWKSKDLPALIKARGELLQQTGDESGATFFLAEPFDV